MQNMQMRQKELRIALVCYGGISLAVYMHGVTKEIWNLTRASRAFHTGDANTSGVLAVYHELLADIEGNNGLRLRILTDILSGASAGGINAIFLGQAIHSGQSLDALTDLWLENADIDRLIDPDARPVWKFAKFWAQPIAWWIFRWGTSAVSQSVAKETRAEVRRKVSQLVRCRWFAPPFSGDGFSDLLYNAFRAMAKTKAEAPLLPAGHPLDLFVSATDFRGHVELLRLNSPPIVEETEHRLPLRFFGNTPRESGKGLADMLELTLAARATASFPGAFPPLRVQEIDRLAARNGAAWTGRRKFLARIMPAHVKNKQENSVSLIDGSVLVNKPFDGAIKALPGRPAQREVDRRFVYIDPRPDRVGNLSGDSDAPIGFFGAVFGSLSTIPREQPIRDNLEIIHEQSRNSARLQRMIKGLRPEVENEIARLFGRTLFLNRPTPKRLALWRAKAQQAAAEEAGYAYHSYAQAKFTRIIDELAQLTIRSGTHDGERDLIAVTDAFTQHLQGGELATLSGKYGGANAEAIAFFRTHDLGFRIRRLRLLVRRLSREWEADPEIDEQALDAARDSVYKILSLYFDRDKHNVLGDDFAEIAAKAVEEPGLVLEALGSRRLLPETDRQAEEMLAEALEAMPQNLRRRCLLAYLGFPFYDIATLPLMHNDGMSEINPVKVDRISPDDARTIRKGGARATLRGIEFYNFGAFFSRAYRENDYLWGRLHGAERMIDIISSTLDTPLPTPKLLSFKKRAFLAILADEEARLKASADLIASLRREVEERIR